MTDKTADEQLAALGLSFDELLARYNRANNYAAELEATIEQTWRPEVMALRKRIAELEAYRDAVEAALA